jgi:UDP-glucose 4-epimerase
MRILITGGLGYLGSYLGRELVEHLDCKVRILTKNVPPAFESWRERYEIIQADVTEREQVRECCRACDAVLHLAALDRAEARADPRRALLVSGIGTRNILEEARLAKVPRVVYFSTIHVYGKGRGTPIHETSEVRPLDDYSIAHLLGELYCEQSRESGGISAIRLRLANGFGAPVDRSIDCWSLVVHDLCRSAIKHREIVIKSRGTQTRDFIAISDVLKATRLVLEAAPDLLRHSLYHVASGVSVSINEVAARVAKVYRELRGEAIEIVHRAVFPDIEVESSPVIDIERIRGVGFEPEPSAFMDSEIRRILEVLS